jgi:hypothetical protein
VSACAAVHDDAPDPDDPFAPELLGGRIGELGQVAETLVVRVEDKLGDPFSVAKIDEDAPSMVAIVCDPAEEDDLFAFVRGAQLASVMRAFQLVDEPGHEASDRMGPAA